MKRVFQRLRGPSTCGKSTVLRHEWKFSLKFFKTVSKYRNIEEVNITDYHALITHLIIGYFAIFKFL